MKCMPTKVILYVKVFFCKRQRKEESRGKTKGGQIKYKYKEKRKKEKFYVDTEL